MTDQEAPIETTTETPPPAEPPAAPPPVEAGPVVEEENPYEQSAVMAERYATLEMQLAETQRQMAEVQEKAAREAAARQDDDLISKRDTLRRQFLESDDERQRTLLSWQLNDLEGELSERRLRRYQQPQQAPKATTNQEALSRRVWESFAATNRITQEEHQKMWMGLQERAAKGEKVQEGPQLYAQLLRDVRRGTKTAPATKAPPMVEGTGATGNPPASTQSRFDKSMLDRAAKWFGNAVSAEDFAKMTGGNQ